MRSATSRTSRSLWVMKTIEVPGRLELAHDRHELVGLLRGEHRGRLVEDEHLRVAGERLDDLDALLHADGQVLDERVGVDVEAEAVGDLAHALARAASRSRTPPALVGSWPSMTFSATVKTGMSMKCWCTMPMPARHRVAGAGEVLHDVVEQDLALVGLVEAVEHVHQRRLAGAVLAEEAVDLAGLDDEVDVVVGDEAAEPLGDAAEFELHAPDPSEWARSERAGWMPGTAGGGQDRPACPVVVLRVTSRRGRT